MKRDYLLAALFGSTMILTACGGGGGGGGAGPGPDPDPDPDPTDCPAGFDGLDFLSCDGNTFTVSGTIDQDFTMTADRDWILDGQVLVGGGNIEISDNAEAQQVKDDGVVLTIEAGTDIRGLTDGVLIVTRGSRMEANGTVSAPITFSSLDADFDGLGEWGGVIIQGFAPQFRSGNLGECFAPGDTFCNLAGEGGAGFFGGNDPADDSGTVRYVRIAEGGTAVGVDDEVNGLTMQGVGYQTTVEYVQVHNNLDDAFEWFGGTVNARYIVATGNDDDSIDYDEGYMGNIQYALVLMGDRETPEGNNDPRGIEANSSDDEYVPQTNATLANVTLLGAAANNNPASANGAQPGMRLRGALTTAIYNTAVNNFDTGCIRIDDADPDADGPITELVLSDVTLVNVIGDCQDGFYDRRDADTETGVTGAATFTVDDAYAINEAIAELGSPTTIVATSNGSGFVFDQTDYIGAVEPGTAAGDAWWAGWTLPGTLVPEEEGPAPADFVSCNGDICTIEGTIDTDYTLVNSVQWILDGQVLVGGGNIQIADNAEAQQIKDDGVTLTIQPGTDIRGLTDGVLIVTRGSKLEAAGTANAPITFSSLDENFDGLGEWGGVIVQGFAPQFRSGNLGVCFAPGDTFCNLAGEGGAGFFGGDDPADDSGTIRYVRIAEGGTAVGVDDEVNGLTMQGVGHATQVAYVQVHNNLDDAFEWFGGTVNARYIVATGNDDDSIDYDEGYMGNIQYAIVIMADRETPEGNNDPRGIEANSSDDEYVTQTNATLANVTILGAASNNNPASANGAQPGMRLRGALTTAIYNTAVNNFDTGCIRIDDADPDADGPITELVLSDVTLVNVIGDCQDGFYDRRDADTETNSGAATFGVDAALALTGSPTITAPTIVPVDNGSGFEFDATDYIGAVEPGTAAGEAWWAGWTLPGTVAAP
ncbi:hypothetical protein [Panacagrimonas sp.]|uniref:hypothetical protein n=1 Tax=Panacagrimonas sp. TaxID=2480088 RepID=UPI003B52852F